MGELCFCFLEQGFLPEVVFGGEVFVMMAVVIEGGVDIGAKSDIEVVTDFGQSW